MAASSHRTSPSTTSQASTSPGRIVWALTALIGFGCASATAVGFAGSLWWRLDLFAHFRVQYAVLLAVVVVLCGVMRRPLAGFAAAAVLAVNLAVIAPLYLDDPAPPATGAPGFDVLLFNLHHDNTQREPITRYLRERDADVVVALEVTRAWSETLQAALPGHELVGEWREDAFGIAVLSRLPMNHHAVRYLADSSLPAVEIIVEHGKARIAVLGLHPPPPVERELAHERDAIIAAAAAWAVNATARSQKHPADHVVVVGDMNATPWSHAMGRFIERSGLIDSQRGFGVQMSWPAQLWPLRVPIDHVLHSPSLTTRRRELGPFLGSDHRPVHVTLAPSASSATP